MLVKVKQRLKKVFSSEITSNSVYFFQKEVYTITRENSNIFIFKEIDSNVWRF
ncbi:hypothetical protein bcgnr5390_63130 [Bacillus luti]